MVQVLDEAFDVYLPWLGVEKRIYMDKLQDAGHLVTYEYHKADNVLHLVWKVGYRIEEPGIHISGPTCFNSSFIYLLSQKILTILAPAPPVLQISRFF